MKKFFKKAVASILLISSLSTVSMASDSLINVDKNIYLKKAIVIGDEAFEIEYMTDKKNNKFIIETILGNNRKNGRYYIVHQFGGLTDIRTRKNINNNEEIELLLNDKIVLYKSDGSKELYYKGYLVITEDTSNTVDKSVLSTLIDDAKGIKKADSISKDGLDIPNNKTWVTKEVDENLRTLLSEAQAALSNDSLSQEDINSLTDKLNSAINDYKPVNGNATNQVQEAKAIIEKNRDKLINTTFKNSNDHFISRYYTGYDMKGDKADPGQMDTARRRMETVSYNLQTGSPQILEININPNPDLPLRQLVDTIGIKAVITMGVTQAWHNSPNSVPDNLVYTTVNGSSPIYRNELMEINKNYLAASKFLTSIGINENGPASQLYNKQFNVKNYYKLPDGSLEEYETIIRFDKNWVLEDNINTNRQIKDAILTSPDARWGLTLPIYKLISNNGESISTDDIVDVRIQTLIDPSIRIEDDGDYSNNLFSVYPDKLRFRFSNPNNSKFAVVYFKDGTKLKLNLESNN